MIGDRTNECHFVGLRADCGLVLNTVPNLHILQLSEVWMIPSVVAEQANIPGVEVGRTVMTGALRHGTVGGAFIHFAIQPDTFNGDLADTAIALLEIVQGDRGFIRHLDRTTAGDDAGTTEVGLRVLRIRAAPAKAVMCVAIQVGIIEGAFQEFLTESVLDLRDVVIDLIA